MVDLTLAAIPFYFSTMGAEAWWQERNRGDGPPTPGGYERSDTIASLAMGVGSLVVPAATRPLMRNFDIRTGRWTKAALGLACAAGAVTVLADAVTRAGGLEAGARPSGDTEEATASSTGTAPAQSSRASRRARMARLAKRVGGSAAVAAIAGTGAVVAGTWANRTMAQRLWNRRVLPDWGNGPAAAIAAIFAWDAIYYWNHRIQHESRYLWAIHVVHHSSEHYNLSTALRQPVADSFGTFVPYGLMALLGIRPELIEQARGVNLIYQYWIHTDVIRSIGPLERILNTPSHHRVHHGANRQYLDRNHGSILILWDKLFGTFEPEDEPVRYGLTKNIETFNPVNVATHEYADIVADVAAADNWSDRIGFVVRGPGWAYERRDGMGLAQPAGAEASHSAPAEPAPA